METRFPTFVWRGHVDEYFPPGTYFFRRDTLDLDQYLSLLELNHSANMFYLGEQGILNFMLFSLADAGQIRLIQKPFQTLICDWPEDVIRQRFPLPQGCPPSTPEPWVLHWAGPDKVSAMRSPHHTFFRDGFYQSHARRRIADLRFTAEKRRSKVILSAGKVKRRLRHPTASRT